MTPSSSSAVPVQNLHTDGSELQLVTENHPEQELNKNTSPLPHTGNVPEFQGFQTSALACSSSVMEMELRRDEVFVISNPDTSLFSPCPVSPGSVVDAGDALKVPSAQHQRRSQQLCEPDGALCGLEQEVEVMVTADEDLSIPVFVISEEDDREPLVSSEGETQVKHGESRNHESSSLSSAHSAFVDEESADVRNTFNKVQLPLLSHVTAPWDSMGTDI